MKVQTHSGFTLVEMLVVIAIVAILVAVVVPTVSSSVNKAAAVSDAANLRILSAEAAIVYLSGKETENGIIRFSPPSTFTVVGGPTAKTRGLKGQTATITLDLSTMLVSAEYGGHDLDYFTEIAETGKIPSAS